MMTIVDIFLLLQLNCLSSQGIIATLKNNMNNNTLVKVILEIKYIADNYNAGNKFN